MQNNKIYEYYKSKIQTQETVIMIEGAGFNPLMSENFALDLQNHFNVVMFYTPGYGGYTSEKPLFSIHDLADRFNLELEKMNINRYHIIGHCMGGSIAQSMTLKKPNNVENLVLISTSCGSYQRIISQEYLTYVRQFRKLHQYMFAENFIKNNPLLIADFDSKAYEICKIPREYLTSQCFASLSFSSVKESPMIKSPTLVIHGDADLTMNISFGEKLAKNIPNSKFLKLNKIGHHPFTEKPEVINDIIAFLTGNYNIGETLDSSPAYSEQEIAHDEWFREYVKTKDFAKRIQRMYKANDNEIINEAINNIK